VNVLLIGHGRMGRLVEALARDAGCDIAATLDGHSNHDGAALDRPWAGVDVAIDFSTADAVAINLPRLASRRINMVIGTTGWQAEEPRLRQVALDAGVGVVAAANFSPGVNLFEVLVERAGGLFPSEPWGAWLHELHHSKKRDAPSGTAIVLKAALERGGYDGPIDVASTRAGSIPGTHTIGLDGRFETITLTHATRDRATFAQGALLAAQWVVGKRGWFTMKDVLGLS
jgi:4-hydroxy-tetrahydrodipicolinate reductase